MLPADTFRDRTILITGGGTGLGRSMGQYLLRLGARLAICGRRREVVEQAAAEMAENQRAAECLAVPCDVRKAKRWRQCSRRFDNAWARFTAW